MVPFFLNGGGGGFHDGPLSHASSSDDHSDEDDELVMSGVSLFSSDDCSLEAVCISVMLCAAASRLVGWVSISVVWLSYNGALVATPDMEDCLAAALSMSLSDSHSDEESHGQFLH